MGGAAPDDALHAQHRVRRVEDDLSVDRLVESRPNVADRSHADDVLPRRALAFRRSDLDNPHRRQRASAPAQANDGHGIAGHEFFSADGKTIWYDLQTPKSKVFWLAGVDVATGRQTRYPVAREEWSVHFNTSPDGSLFAGDGGGPRSVASPGNGQWIYLFTPSGGLLNAERLVDLSKHDYQLEPNVTFTPDQKWITFRSNMHGATHVYAVEVVKAR